MVLAAEVPEVSAFGSSWLLVAANTNHGAPVVSTASAEEVAAFGEKWPLHGSMRKDRPSTPMAPVEQVPEVSAFGSSWLLSGSNNDDVPSIPTVQAVSLECNDIEGLVPEVMAFGNSWCLPENDRRSIFEEVPECTSFGSSWLLSGSVNSSTDSLCSSSMFTAAKSQDAEAAKTSPVKRSRSASPAKETPCKQRRTTPAVTPALAQLRALIARPDARVSSKVSPGFCDTMTANDEMACAAKHIVLSN